MKTVHRIVLLCLLYAGAVWAQGNLEINYAGDQPVA